MYVPTILAPGVISQTDCDYGWFEEVNGECQFDCEYDGNYISLDELSFDTIKEDCSDVRLANEAFPSACNSINDLVWRNDSCSCPFCKCSSTSSTKTIEKIDYDPSEYCYEVSCEEPYSWYEGINDMIFRYTTLAEANYVFDWEDYGPCPPQECTFLRYYEASALFLSYVVNIVFF